MAPFIFQLMGIAKIKIRVKNKFRMQTYNPYYQRKELVERIYGLFECGLERGQLMHISKEVNIPYQTLHRWYTTFQRDRNWRPWENFRNLSKKIFSLEQEDIIVGYIQENIIEKKIIYK